MAKSMVISTLTLMIVLLVNISQNDVVYDHNYEQVGVKLKAYLPDIVCNDTHLNELHKYFPYEDVELQCSGVDKFVTITRAIKWLVENRTSVAVPRLDVVELNNRTEVAKESFEEVIKYTAENISSAEKEYDITELRWDRKHITRQYRVFKAFKTIFMNYIFTEDSSTSTIESESEDVLESEIKNQTDFENTMLIDEAADYGSFFDEFDFNQTKLSFTTEIWNETKTLVVVYELFLSR